MQLYDSYSSRHRVGIGVRLKSRQAARIFSFGMRHSPIEVASILEIGPGDGYIAEIAMQRGLSYLGLEGSSPVASALDARGFNVVQARVPPLPAGLGHFQCCFMLHVIEHMRDAAAAGELVAQIRDQLPHNGALVVACPDYQHWNARFFDCDYTHTMPFTRRRLMQLLNDHGFEITAMTIYTGSSFGRGSLPLSWLAKCLYPQFVDNLIGHLIPHDVLNRGLLTFLPNLLAVAIKK